jgi:hypothetical protein
MTKELIFENASLKKLEKHPDQWTSHNEEQCVYECMDEFAKQEAIEFFKWYRNQPTIGKPASILYQLFGNDIFH